MKTITSFRSQIMLQNKSKPKESTMCELKTEKEIRIVSPFLFLILPPILSNRSIKA